MKTVSTKLDKQDFDKLQEMCNQEGQCISEELGDMIKRNIVAYEEGLEMETKPIESTGNPPRHELKVAKISLDNGKTWYENGKQVV